MGKTVKKRERPERTFLAGARAIWRNNFSARSLRKNEGPWTFKRVLSAIEGHFKKSFKPALILVQTI